MGVLKVMSFPLSLFFFQLSMNYEQVFLNSIKIVLTWKNIYVELNIPAIFKFFIITTTDDGFIL